MRARSATAEKQGYLFKQSRGLAGWKRRWFVVKDGELHYFRSWRDLKRAGVINLALCSVRPAEHIRKYCFEIVSRHARHYVLQAESEEEMHDWIAIIQNATASALTSTISLFIRVAKQLCSASARSAKPSCVIDYERMPFYLS